MLLDTFEEIWFVILNVILQLTSKESLLFMVVGAQWLWVACVPITKTLVMGVQFYRLTLSFQNRRRASVELNVHDSDDKLLLAKAITCKFLPLNRWHRRHMTWKLLSTTLIPRHSLTHSLTQGTDLQTDNSSLQLYLLPYWCRTRNTTAFNSLLQPQQRPLRRGVLRRWKKTTWEKIKNSYWKSIKIQCQLIPEIGVHDWTFFHSLNITTFKRSNLTLNDHLFWRSNFLFPIGELGIER